MVETRSMNWFNTPSSTTAGMLCRMDGPDKVRENRLRRVAARRMLTLSKIRRRDPGAHDFGTYCLTNSRGEEIARCRDLNSAETFLTGYDATSAGIQAHPG
jgi:hypothetical protein